MKRVLLILNAAAALVVVALGAREFLAPYVAERIYGEEYKTLMFQCDHVMREHFIAKQMVLANPSEKSVRNLDAAELGLLTCHEYDKLRKKLLAWGLSEVDLSRLGLEAIEAKADEVRQFVETHEIRYDTR